MDSTTANLVAGYPNGPIDLNAALRHAYSLTSDKPTARIGFAYASNLGLEALLSRLDTIPNWRVTTKEWIIGLHHGITEPVALERICALPNCRLRVFTGDGRLSYNSLRSGRLFHAKVVCIASGRGQTATPNGFIVSSANLTGAALSSGARNYELGLALFSSSFSQGQFVQFQKWWSLAWNASVDYTQTILNRYSQLRDQFLTRNPDSLVDLDPPSVPQISAASTLWIESGAMSGGSRNQVEFSRELTAFFGPPHTGSQLLRVRADGQEWNDRPLSHKTTTFGVDIWRLSLPTDRSFAATRCSHSA
jgi:HKD family nuclease